MPGYCASSPQSPLRAVSACGENSARSLSGSSPHRAGHGGAPWYRAGRHETAKPPIWAALHCAFAAYFKLKNAFIPGYSATSPRRRKVRSAPFPPAAKTLPAPFPAPLPTVRGTAGPPGMELGDGKKQDRRSGPACVSGSAYFKLKNAFMPGYSATSPSSSSMRSS